MANPPSGEKEWIELYNPSSTTSVSGWIIEERTGSDLLGIKQHLLPDFTIQNNGFWIFDFATASLNNSGDIITLKNNLGETVDTYQYNYNEAISGKTFGRQPDGANWIVDLNPSKRNSNGNQSSATPTPTPTPSPAPSPTHTPIPTKTSTPTPTPKKTTSPTNTPIPSSTPIPKNTPTPTINNSYSPTQETSNKISYRIASVAGAQTSATPEAKVEVKDQKQINPFFWAGLIFIFAGVSSIGYIYIKKNAKLHIWFRR